jgi:hypothetical protein
LGAVATDSRNSYLLPHINNFDLTALKRVTIWGERAIEFQAQAFNVLNHSQYIAGSLNTVNSVSTFTSAQTRFVDAGSTAFNNPKLAFPNNARTLQLVANSFSKASLRRGTPTTERRQLMLSLSFQRNFLV